MSNKQSQYDTENDSRRKGSDLMNQMGFGKLANPKDMQEESDDDDGDLETELAVLRGEKVPNRAIPKSKTGPLSMSTIEQQAAQCLQDVDDDNISDTEDPQLLAELAELESDKTSAAIAKSAGHISQGVEQSAWTVSPVVDDKSSCDNISLTSPTVSHPEDSRDREAVSLIQGRILMYQTALQQAREAGDESKQRRLDRGLKILTDLLQGATEGKPINEDETPPPVATGTSTVISSTLSSEAHQAKTSTLSDAGPQDAHQPSTDLTENGTASENISHLPPEPTEEESKRLFQAPEAPKTVLEALVQRLEKYKSSEDTARQDGDSGKARRMGRIVKQYEDAIKTHSAGNPVDFSGLPIPPGFGPIPVDSSSSSQVSPAAAAAEESLSRQQQTCRPQRPEGAAASGASVTADSSPNRSDSRQAHQLCFLQERMEEFRTAALKAKKNQNVGLAKEHMRIMKGLEPMIEALKAGQPVDLSQAKWENSCVVEALKFFIQDTGSGVLQVPPSPLEGDNTDRYVTVTEDTCPPAAEDREGVFSQLEQDLIQQIRTCATNSQHFAKLGDVQAASKFQKLEQSCRRDLESVKTARSRGDPVPKFHYETRNFSAVQCNTDLGDGEMELIIVRGICLSLPSGFSEKDMDTLVKYEFSFPSEYPQTGQTATVKETINPEYNAAFKLRIDRKSRSFMRFVERKGIKLEINIKRGLFKGDRLLGSTTVKLSTLDSKCTLHDSFDLTEGRKAVGGKLEVKVRVRDPFKGRQVEESTEKWLVIDQFIHNLSLKTQTNKNAKSSVCTIL